MRWVGITYSPVWYSPVYSSSSQYNPTIYFQPTENFSLSTNCTIFSLSTRHPLRPRPKTRSHISSTSSPSWHFLGKWETSWRISRTTPPVRQHRFFVWLLFRFIIFLSCRVAASRLFSLPVCHFIVDKLNECYFTSYRAQKTFLMTATPRIPFIVTPEASPRTYFKWTQWILHLTLELFSVLFFVHAFSCNCIRLALISREKSIPCSTVNGKCKNVFVSSNTFSKLVTLFGPILFAVTKAHLNQNGAVQAGATLHAAVYHSVHVCLGTVARRRLWRAIIKFYCNAFVYVKT